MDLLANASTVGFSSAPDPLVAGFDDDAISPDFDLGFVRAAVADLMRDLGERPQAPSRPAPALVRPA